MEEAKMKFFETTFHSKELVPWEVAKLGRDSIRQWVPDPNAKYWITDGLEIAHRDNPALKLWVTRVLLRSKDIKTGEKDNKGEFIVETRTKIEGVLVHWWQEV